MTQQFIITTPVNSGLGDPAPLAFNKANANFSELYALQTSVKAFGAIGNGVADDTAAFNAAVAAAPSMVPYTGSTITIGPAATVYVPPGTYLITSQIVVNGVNITWQLSDGAVIIPSTNYALLNGRILREGKQDNQYTFGIFYTACGFSTRNNVPIDSAPAVMGFTAPSQISAYPTCDSVACYADNTAVAPLAIISGSGTTYTTTTINFTSALSSTILGQMKAGMIVQTTNDPVSFYSGFVTSWSANAITVSAWYQQGNSASGQTPPNANGAWVSPITKIFAYNGNVTLRSITGSAQQAAGFEIGVLNNNVAPSGFIGTFPLVWGYDCVNLGTFACDTAFNARHNNAGFFTGFQVSGVNNAGTTVYGYFDQTAHGASVTTLGASFISAPTTVVSATNLATRVGFLSTGTVNSSSTVSSVIHFQASGASISGTTTTQVGFLCAALSGATNNRGFVGSVSSAANNYNLYLSGTASNYMAGNLGIGAVPLAGNSLTTASTALTGATQVGIEALDTLSGTGASIGVLVAQSITASTAVTAYTGLQVNAPTLNAGATIATLTGLHIGALSSGGTNNYALTLGVAASGSANFNIFANGTAPNFFAGYLNITGAAASVASGLSFGGTSQTTVGATGAASALPANPLGYLIGFFGATKIAIPYYNG